MRTTIRLDDELLRDARAAAVRTGRTLTAVIEESLREALSRAQDAGERPRVPLPTFKGGGVMPGVDLDDSAALATLMDDRGPA